MVVRKRVRVVDDEGDFLATYERLLRREGHEGSAATSRADGVAAVAREHPDLVIWPDRAESPRDVLGCLR